MSLACVSVFFFFFLQFLWYIKESWVLNFYFWNEEGREIYTVTAVNASHHKEPEADEAEEDFYWT